MASASTSSSRRSGRRGKKKCGATNAAPEQQGQPCSLQEALAEFREGRVVGVNALLTNWVADPEMQRLHRPFRELHLLARRTAPSLPSELLPPPL